MRFSTPSLSLVLAAAVACSGGSKSQSGQGVSEPTPTPVEPTPTEPAPAEAAKPTPEEAKAFIDATEKELRRLTIEQARADWAKQTNITDETSAAAAKAGEAMMGFLTKTILASAKFVGISDQLDPDTRRKLLLIRVAAPTVAPTDPTKAAELAKITAEMDGEYGKGKVCDVPAPLPEEKGQAKKAPPAADAKKKPAEEPPVAELRAPVCKDLGALEDILAKSRKPAELLAAWQGWHDTVGKTIRPYYERFIELGNEGARGIGFADMGEAWRSAYDMPPADFEKEVDRLWTQMEPLYKDLHCYTRRKLSQKYGKDVVSPTGPIPAHLLGNMWAQDWGYLYPELEPYKGQPQIDVTPTLVKQKYDPIKMVKVAEAFFVSLGLDPLPQTFWERSMFTKPADKEVVCHASAWNVEIEDDLRIKMCIKINAEDLTTVHHELGHNYYYHYYYNLPILYQNGANDGFHEAIGDTIVLSMTPGYLKQVGLLAKVANNPKSVINQQMQRALEGVAFLPWGMLVDKWRWDVFSGKVGKDAYNKHWWDLRLKYQGVAPAATRGEEFFDPGAKYHVPGNTPYMRYFLARLLQFQFHRALCKISGHQGPLHECSIFGNKTAGEKLKAVLQMGASKPWQEALEVMTGEKQIDATAMLDYFAPLHAYLKEQNKGQQCGW